MAGARITARLFPSATQHTKGGDSTEAVAAFFHIHNCPAPTPEGCRKGRIAVPHGPYGTAIRQGLQGRGMKAKGACLAQAQEKVSLRPAIPMAANSAARHRRMRRAGDHRQGAKNSWGSLIHNRARLPRHVQKSRNATRWSARSPNRKSPRRPRLWRNCPRKLGLTARR